MRTKPNPSHSKRVLEYGEDRCSVSSFFCWEVMCTPLYGWMPLPCQVSDYQDNMSYYVESNQDPDFEEDETMYDDLVDGSGETEETWYAV